MIAVDNRGVSNPYLNLALEEYLVRHIDCSNNDFLLLYANTPCVVLGKNQSVYKEVNFSYLKNKNAVVVRRVSGGGTVYHDEGNLNFAFISSFHNSKLNNYSYFNQKLIHALKQRGLDAGMDARNNIIVEGKKVSGGAQFTNRKNILIHGTLLCNATLSELRSSLAENSFAVETKAPVSVKSSVANLTEFDSAFASVEEVRKLVMQAYGVTETHQLSTNEWQQVEQLAKEQYNSFEWIYGRSPHTVIHRSNVIIEVTEGVIVRVESSALPTHVTQALVGVRYRYTEIKKALSAIPNALDYLEEIF